ncbi:MAG TPA: chloride channel protein [Pirellulales bacterium]|nr:chloride channel protein [Pirellulales bacterium]
MAEEEIVHAATSAGVSISPSLDLVAESAQVPHEAPSIDARVVWLCGVAIILGVAGALVAEALIHLIDFITNFSFYGTLSLDKASPAGNHLGVFVIAVPIIGGLIIGFMARYGSQAIRGHGIPEAMEQVLTNRSRIPARVTFLKPISAAIAMGTGGPFGAEGPIIATGGALGSLLGQFVRTTPAERKTLLAVGAAAGMSAVFGSPVAAVLLSIELLLFEFRPRSMIPVALAAATAAGMRIIFEGSEPVFPMPAGIQSPHLMAMAFYILLGAVMGVAAAAVTRILYAVEDAFERLPVHWMWWPAIGAVAVGIIGYFEPHTLGVGYSNVTAIISNNWSTRFVAVMCFAKFVSWAIALGSGTSGGTMAPLFTVGGGLGQVLGAVAVMLVPAAGIDLRIAALVGMAAMFAGASRALLTSTVLAFETTLQPLCVLPLLGGCAASYLVASLLTKTSIMTEKIVRRGVAAPHEYAPDLLQQVLVGAVAAKKVIALRATQTVKEVRAWMAADGPDSRHQGFPIVDSAGVLQGVLTRRDILEPQTPESKTLKDLLTRLPKFVYESTTVRQAADHMARHNIGRLPVLSHEKPPKIVGMITRSDILSVYRRELDESAQEAPTLKVPRLGRRKTKRKA